MKETLSAEIIGHKPLRKFLANSAKNLRHHAYLFAGPSGSGKDTVARDFIGFFVGKKINDWRDVASEPDVAILAKDPEKKLIGVAELRAFEARFALTSVSGKIKIGVILGAQDLSLEAANAFLKTLEEPSGRAIFLLVADDIAKIPATVRSRSAVVRFLPVPEKEIVAGLVARGSSREEASVAAREALGRPGVGLTLVTDKKAAVERRQAVASFLDFISRPLAGRMSAAQSLAEDKKSGGELARVLDLWLSVLRDLMLAKTGNNKLIANASSEKRINELAAGVSREKILAAAKATAGAKRLLSANVSPRLLIENIALTI